MDIANSTIFLILGIIFVIVIVIPAIIDGFNGLRK